jgi:hypothetical protein
MMTTVPTVRIAVKNPILCRIVELNMATHRQASTANIERSTPTFLYKTPASPFVSLGQEFETR